MTFIESVKNIQDLYFDHILIFIIMFDFDIIIVYFGKFYMIKWYNNHTNLFNCPGYGLEVSWIWYWIRNEYTKVKLDHEINIFRFDHHDWFWHNSIYVDQLNMIKWCNNHLNMLNRPGYGLEAYRIRFWICNGHTIVTLGS